MTLLILAYAQTYLRRRLAQREDQRVYAFGTDRRDRHHFCDDGLNYQCTGRHTTKFRL
ncbi:uncharacterized protein SPAPADRAFT_62163 [Spathaspora passalidarum NRRL Y-27907]|uniref:Uncharacterized protein n=1 Tax=Spathaspora passalidarum (strain NRRL Y-27907 / 11-Y1) TaxID=619300 RepID=G3AQL0_SPAPN|nr:uncharacterized protein SPAPADRAFT_62163 [Spathaspora passalidarum NRRL Y-27907]EGW31557.1 hypothetical protein SPAPADRAFT_62163 [Spathaspora passalidarum NRRL Y-27907]